LHLPRLKYESSENKLTAFPGRQIASVPEKILDAPDMINDFYLHLMDWSSLNHMAVALSAGVFIWNATDGTILQLCQREVEEEYVASVSWIKVTTLFSIA
jgi:cell division cycle protein 20 (cofactor of APC complex)